MQLCFNVPKKEEKLNTLKIRLIGTVCISVQYFDIYRFVYTLIIYISLNIFIIWHNERWPPQKKNEKANVVVLTWYDSDPGLYNSSLFYFFNPSIRSVRTSPGCETHISGVEIYSVENPETYKNSLRYIAILVSVVLLCARAV